MKNVWLILSTFSFIFFLLFGLCEWRNGFLSEIRGVQDQNSKLDQENQTLRDNNASLQNDCATLKVKYSVLEHNYFILRETNSVLETNVSICLNYLKINDYIQEHKAELVKNLQEKWVPCRSKLFKEAGGTGQLVDFSVEDAMFYKGYFVVTTVNVWTNSDSSNGVSRTAVYLDPDKNYAYSKCAMLDQRFLSPQEFASLEDSSSNNVALFVQADGEKNEAALDPPAQPATHWFSDGDKEKLYDAAISIGTAWISAWVQHSFDTPTDNQ